MTNNKQNETKMKKLLMLAAIAAFAGAAQAATLSWQLMGNKLPSGTAGAMATLLFVTDQSQNFGATPTSVDAVSAILDSGSATFTTETDSSGKTKVTGITDGTDTIYVAAAGTTTTAGGLSGATNYGAGNWTPSDSLHAFVVLFDAADVTTAQSLNYIASGVQGGTFPNVGAQTLRFGTVAAANANWKPVAVPEPASAALALAGLALLLKRRRA